jgi:hypothetical protein
VLPYRSVVYGLAKPVGTFDPFWPNVQHLFRISSSGAEPNAQTLTDKARVYVCVCVCLCVYLCACVCLCVCICVSVCVSACMR